MSTLRVTGLRAIRPQLSPRFQALRRYESTTSSNAKLPSDSTSTTATTTNTADLPIPPPPAEPSPPPPPKPSFFRENRLLLISGTLAVALGFFGTSALLSLVNPPPFPAPGSPGDAVLMADLQARIDTDFKVNVMRGKCLSAGRQLKGSSDAAGGWVEVLPATYEALVGTEPQKPGFTLVAGGSLIQNLHGAGRLGVERVFFNRSTRELVAVVWFGGALSGWPGVTHGGLLATALSEKIALAAQLAAADKRSGLGLLTENILGAAHTHARVRAPQPVSTSTPTDRSPSLPINQLTLSYRKPTKANNFYVVRVTPSGGPARATTDGARLLQTYKATIEQITGEVCVESRAEVEASAEVPEASALKPKAGGGGAKGVSERYQQFKQSLWPSRQSQMNSSSHD